MHDGLIAVCGKQNISIYNFPGLIFRRAVRHPGSFEGGGVSAWDGFVFGRGWMTYIPSKQQHRAIDLKLPTAEGMNCTFANEAQRLLVAGPSGQIYSFSSPTAPPARLARPIRAYPYGLAVTSSGGLVALGYKTNLQGRIPNEQNALVLVSGSTGKVLQKKKRPDGIESLAFNPSGTLLAEASRSGKIFIYCMGYR
jgi:hypothetical protein